MAVTRRLNTIKFSLWTEKNYHLHTCYPVLIFNIHLQNGGQNVKECIFGSLHSLPMGFMEFRIFGNLIQTFHHPLHRMPPPLLPSTILSVQQPVQTEWKHTASSGRNKENTQILHYWSFERETPLSPVIFLLKAFNREIIPMSWYRWFSARKM